MQIIDLSLFSSSGLTHEGHTRDVEQVYLRCSQGSLEWLYPTGAIIVNLRPNTVSPAAAKLSVCIKPSTESSGANIYLDRTGKLRLLLHEEDQALGKVLCFGIQEGALFIEAIPHMDISRRTTAFQYELVSNRLGGDRSIILLESARAAFHKRLIQELLLNVKWTLTKKVKMCIEGKTSCTNVAQLLFLGL